MAVDLLPAVQPERYWQPSAWKPIHRIVVSLHCSGWQNQEIAEHLGKSQGWVSQILNDPRARFEILELSKKIADKTIDVGVRLHLYANEALDEVVEELRTARDVRVRQKAAFGILDRAGYTPTKNDSEEGDVVLPAEVVSRMEETTRELVQHRGVYREVEPTPIVVGEPPEGEPISE